MTTDAVGGVWAYALDLAAALRTSGVETILAVLGPNPSSAQCAAAEEAGVRLVETALPLEWLAKAPREVEDAAFAVARLAEDWRPDLIHLNSPALAGCATFPAPVVAVAHSCVATWWRAVRSGPLPEDFAWRAALMGEGYRAADAVLAPSAAFAAATVDAYALERKPIVVHNGRRAPTFAPLAGAPEAAVFTAGRLWDEGKNLVTLDRAAARLPIPVRAAGPLQGPHGGTVALPHLETLGSLSGAEIVAWLASQPIFVSAARYEPFGLAVLEAAHAGCALVLADIPTFRELWDGAAAFVPPEDDEAIAHTVTHLLRDREARARLSRAARAWADAYTVEAMGAGVLRVYRSLVPQAEEAAA